jgi:hypothetical protein
VKAVLVKLGDLVPGVNGLSADAKRLGQPVRVPEVLDRFLFLHAPMLSALT